MGEFITIFMIAVFAFGIGVVVKDALEHADKTRLPRRPSGRS